MARPKTCVLEDSLTIADTFELHQQWGEWVREGKGIRIDASSVENIDTAGLQLLLALKQGLEAAGGSFGFKEVSDKLMAAARQTDLADPLGIDQ